MHSFKHEIISQIIIIFFLYFKVFLVLYYYFILVFQDSVSLCSPGCPRISCVDQAGLKPIEICVPLPLGLKGHATTSLHSHTFQH